ncbi:MAG: N-acetyl-alpha-D-glucosaminyl L-malate synthase BshA [Bacteroidota bacterium]|nr:N-acetyl-alpha-D-glucosaminyl L-malate synthase BshA [Bacteroidota bacterium]MDP4233956.1 N-acetyl-alpha-D-glucosaminyl L-malate synthase BshA [Bacteroidota bacterium]MDP4242793.1 N-acetyl-alpha-D-glucosaminyl L-malate synthase BshA [Bacteroidota bacterium]MDP4288507.1 N-acetyl-alpha-D-glucosaminyl L-malate synthase BshA [Bacteroidota bacterium]
MNIGITCYPTYGGSGVVATELGKSLASRGHRVHFITYALPMRLTGIGHTESEYIDNIFYHEVEMSTYPLFEFPLYSMALTSKMVEVARFEKLDLIHAHYAIPHATSAVLAKQILRDRDIKIVTTLHGTDITLVGLEPSFEPLMKFSIESSDGVTAVSRYLRDETIGNYGVGKEIEVIPNFIDTEVFRPVDAKNLRRLLAPNGEKLLIHISNFREVKRVKDAIRALKIILESGVKAKFLLVGDGPDRGECQALARDLGIWQQTRFLGKQSELASILSASDVFLIPSGNESFGLSALEAMACGVPVVSSDVGGLPELNIDGETGFVVGMGDVNGIADRTIQMLRDPDLHASLSRGALHRAVTVFSKESIVPMYEAAYERALSGT